MKLLGILRSSKITVYSSKSKSSHSPHDTLVDVGFFFFFLYAICISHIHMVHYLFSYMLRKLVGEKLAHFFFASNIGVHRFTKLGDELLPSNVWRG